MSRSKDSNFLPNICCPYCNRVGPYAISGFAGELSVRAKLCQKCGREFTMAVLVVSAFPWTDIDTDNVISSLKQKVGWLKKQREKARGLLLLEHEAAQKARGLLLLEHEAAQRLYNESLVEANRKRRKGEMN